MGNKVEIKGVSLKRNEEMRRVMRRNR